MLILFLRQGDLNVVQVPQSTGTASGSSGSLFGQNPSSQTNPFGKQQTVGAFSGLKSGTSPSGVTPFSATSPTTANQSASLFSKNAIPAIPSLSATPSSSTPFSTSSPPAILNSAQSQAGHSFTSSASSPFGNKTFQSGATPFQQTTASSSQSTLFSNSSTAMTAPTLSFSPQSTIQQPSVFGSSQTSPLMSPNTLTAEQISLRLRNIYAKHEPSKIEKIPQLMAKYAGNEMQLLANVEKKYGSASNPQSSFGSAFIGAPASQQGSPFSMSSLGGPRNTNSLFGSTGQVNTFGSNSSMSSTQPVFGQPQQLSPFNSPSIGGVLGGMASSNQFGSSQMTSMQMSTATPTFGSSQPLGNAFAGKLVL
jgi:hypothetical protein